MSNIYIQEPPTEGKVCLETTAGDIDIELWSREAPKACRNFVQLCMEGYYDGTIFHRLVKGFIVQGGDPTGTGMGGNSIWGKTFKLGLAYDGLDLLLQDEFHSRLRFVRRGLVAMANAGKDDNGSQFFFTLGATPELQNKHTIFGKVGGNTVYNMLKLEDGLTDENEKPLYPHKILRTKILSNPFSDIEPRQSIKRVRGEKKDRTKSTAAATKNYKLLSFGEEAEEEEGEVEKVNKKFSGKSKSSHDLIKDPKLSSEPAVDQSAISKRSKKLQTNSESESDSVIRDEEMKEIDCDEDDLEEKERGRDKREKDVHSVRDKLRCGKKKVEELSKSSSKSDGKPSKGEDGDEFYLGKDDKIEQKKMLDNLRQQYKELKRSMKKEKEVKDEESEKMSREAKDKAAKLAQHNSIIKAYMEEQEKYKNVKAKAPKKGEDREAMTLALLAKFKTKIETAKESFSEKDLPSISPMQEGQEADNDEDNPDDISWLARKLHYDDTNEVLAKDANRKGDDWFDIYDPRNALTKRRREKAHEESKEKKRARINN